MILLSFTGCGGSESTAANSSEAEKNETVVENAGSEVTEIVEEEEPVMEAQEGITEQLKAENQMEWVRRMNSIRSRAEEIVWDELTT